MADLICRHVDSIWEYGQQTALTKWLASLPDEILCRRPELLTSHAFVLCMSGQFERAEARSTLAEASSNPDNRLVQGMAATVRAYTALYRNDDRGATEHAHQALDHLPADQHLCRCLATSILGDAHAFCGHVPTSERTWTEALHEAEAAGSIFFTLLISAKLVVAQKRQGRLRQADETAREHIGRAAERGLSEVAIAGALYAARHPRSHPRPESDPDLGNPIDVRRGRQPTQ